MTEEKINRIICEWMGDKYHKPTPIEIASGSYYQYEPDFFNNLNTIREAEVKIWNEKGLKIEYIINLFYITINEQRPEKIKPLSIFSYAGFKIITATSQQRSVALVKTIGKWEE